MRASISELDAMFVDTPAHPNGTVTLRWPVVPLHIAVRHVDS